VRELLTNLNLNFKQNAEMEEVISVDKQMIPYKGTLGIKVYMKNKPSKWGIKVRYLLLFVKLPNKFVSFFLPCFFWLFCTNIRLFYRFGHWQASLDTCTHSTFLVTT
jgi:hypothetical protein